MAILTLTLLRAEGLAIPMETPEASPATEAPHIIQRPIPFGEYRKKLTLDYIRVHYDPAAQDINIVPRMIVLHWTASSSAKSALATFDPDEAPLYRWWVRRAGKVNVSAHFLVDRDGTIYQLMPIEWMARHTIGLNRVAIGIENVGGPRWPLTDKQVQANAELVRHLVVRLPTIQYLIGHQEYLSFRGTPLWEERDPSYATGKIDPGPDFLRKLREKVADLHLASHYKVPERPTSPP